eukprot:COSAG01_NODE_5346_length_4320_cov_6.836532_3_plen_78_part_00
MVGCALDLDRGTLSFFLNGRHLGRACEGIAVSGGGVPWCLAVALHEPGDQVDVTLGLGGFLSGDDVERRLLDLLDDL